MRVKDLHWTCPKCNSKVDFGYELSTLFDEDDNEAYFCPKGGVPFYVIDCDNPNCNATWTFGISNMYESDFEE